MSEQTEKDIKAVTDEIREMLIKKNRSYGDSALNPKRIFSRADCVEQLKVRIDDKLSRLQSGNGDLGEDTEQDLMGYLILLRIARKREQASFLAGRKMVSAHSLAEEDEDMPIPKAKEPYQPSGCLKDVTPPFGD